MGLGGCAIDMQGQLTMVDEQDYQEERFSTGCAHWLVAISIVAIADFASTRLPEHVQDTFAATSVALALGVFSLLRGSIGKMSSVAAILLVFLMTFNWHKWPLMFRVQWNVTFVAAAVAGYLLGLWLRQKRRSR